MPENIKPNTEKNPLSKFFRTAEIYIKLPSGGKYWPEGTLNLPANGELPILPMTAKDEIQIQTPDALMNGSGVVEIINSCIPCIVDAWSMPSLDVDYCLISIRIATYGELMDFESTCPKCEITNEFQIDLKAMLDGINSVEFTPVVVDDLTFNLRPQCYRELTEVGMIRFEEEKLVSVINNANLSEEEKIKSFHTSFRKLTELTVSSITNSIRNIVTPDGEVVDNKGYINEYIANSSKKIFGAVSSKLKEIEEELGNLDVSLVCIEDKCKHEYIAPFEFDYSRFFG